MSCIKKIINNTSLVTAWANDPVHAYQIYQVGRYLSSMIISIILVKSGLSSEEIGHFEFVIFLVTTFSFFWSVGIQNALMSFYPTSDIGDKDRILQNVFFVLIILGMIIGVGMVVFPNVVAFIFKSDAINNLIPLAAMLLVVSAPLALNENILFLKKMTTVLHRYTIITLVGTLTTVLLIGMLAQKVENFIFCLICLSFLRLLYTMYLIGLFQKILFHKGLLLQVLWFASPLILHVFISGMMDVVDGWFVTRYFSSSDFAIFRYGARELPFSSVLYSSLSTAMIPLLAVQTISLAQLKAKATGLMHILFPISIVLMLSSSMIFEKVYSSAYKPSAMIFNIYLLILTSRVLLPQAYNIAKHHNKIIIISGIIELGCNIVLSYWWMQVWGIYGLAIATVVSYFIQKIILIWYNSAYHDIHFSSYIDLKYYVIYSILLLFALYLSFNFNI